jgi:hypothetical protein
MKKLLFSALAAFSFMFASAQPASDASTIVSKVQLDNVISIVPPIDFLQTHFEDFLDYQSSGLMLKDIFGNETSPFYVYSNRNFNVTIKAGSPNFVYVGSGTGNNVMPCGVLSYNLFSNSTGGTNATASTWNALKTTSDPLITGGTYGAAKAFSVKLKANPGWNYTGGLYSIGVVLTATQL